MEALIKEKKDVIYFLNSISIPITNDEKEKQLKIHSQLHKNKLPYIYNVRHLAELIDIPEKEIHFYIKNKKKVYTTFQIPKKNGSIRTIHAPIKRLKKIQRWILDNILYQMKVNKYTHGFIKGRSIYTNAKLHENSDLIMGIDLKEFFPSIHIKRVIGFFKYLGYSKSIAFVLSELVTFNSTLPQGSPASPMIANMIAFRLDHRLATFCIKHNLTYSRYADDITISGDKRIPRYKTLIYRIINAEGFDINTNKTRIIGKGARQKVTGLVVNEKVTLGRQKKKMLRAVLHNIKKKGPVEANIYNDPFFKERIQGHLSFANWKGPGHR